MTADFRIPPAAKPNPPCACLMHVLPWRLISDSPDSGFRREFSALKAKANPPRKRWIAAYAELVRDP